MAQEGSRLRITAAEGVSQVRFVDRNILDEANIQQIGEEILGLVEGSAKPRVVISFENVDHLSSAALGALITINNRVKAKSGRLALARIDPQIHEVFVITKLNRLFDIHESVDDAMAAAKR